VGQNAPVYIIGHDDGEFRQGEILSSVTQHVYVHGDTPAVRPVLHAYSIIVSQDCDLLREYEDTPKGKPSAINCILLFEARPAAELKQFFPSAGDRDRKRIFQNNDERYHYLSEVPGERDTSGIGLPDLIVDFRRFYAVPPDELLRQCTTSGTAKRRCRLADLYREHLQVRMAFYMQRVELPEPHQT
jgi:hypothetical protein